MFDLICHFDFLFCFVSTGWISSIHRGAAASCEIIFLYVVQPAGGQTQILQETRETDVARGGASLQGRTSGEFCLFFLIFLVLDEMEFPFDSMAWYNFQCHRWFEWDVRWETCPPWGAGVFHHILFGSLLKGQRKIRFGSGLSLLPFWKRQTWRSSLSLSVCVCVCRLTY